MKYRDLTAGSVPKQLLAFAFPLLLSNLLQSAYSLADMAIVGQFTGSAGLAAVSSCAMLCYILQAACTGLTTGGGVLVAQAAGAHDTDGQARAIGALFTVSAAAAAVMTCLSLLLYRPVLALMQVPAAAMGGARAYMFIFSLGTAFSFGYNAVCAVLRGLGDSQSPLLFVAVAAVGNIALDLLFVGPLGWGAGGAALATVLSQGLSFGFAALYLRRRRFPFRRCRNRALYRAILRLGLPSSVQMAVLNLSYLLVTGMLNGYGVTVAAAAGVGLKVNTFAAMPCWAVGQAVSTMAGQCMGAGNPRRAARTAQAGLAAAVLCGLGMMAAIQLGAAPILRLFGGDGAMVRAGVTYLRICCSVNFAVYAVMYVLDSFATGVGDALFAMGNALLHALVARMALSILLAYVLGWGYTGLCWAEMLCPIPSCIAGVLYFARGRWKNRRALTR